MSAEPVSHNDLANELLSEGSKELALGSLPIEVQDHAAAYSAAVSDQLQIGNDAAAAHAHLSQQKDLIPSAGFGRLTAEIRNEASIKSRDASTRATKALSDMKDALVATAQPKSDPAREQLNRQEALLSICLLYTSRCV